MKKSPIISCVALAAAACTSDERVEADVDGEATLAAELRNYEQAGPAVSCINLRGLGGNRSAGETAILFDGGGGRLWVNRPPAGCTDMSIGRALKVQTTGSRLCRGDIATVFDPPTGITYGGCGLGDFTPYRRVKS